MTNSYFNGGSLPAPNAPGASLSIRSEFTQVTQGFDKLPELSGLTAGQIVRVNLAGTSLESISTIDGYTFTNVTISSGTITGVALSGLTAPLPIASGGTGTTSTQFTNLGVNVTGTLPIANGGTGTTSTQFTNLGVNVTGTLPIANGGTNAATAAGARASILPTFAGNAGKALVVNGGGTDVEYAVAVTGTMSSQNADAVAITGGSIGGVYLAGEYLQSESRMLSGISNLAIVANAAELDMSAGDAFLLGVNANVTIDIVNVSASYAQFAYLQLTDAGSYTVTFTSPFHSIIWVGSVFPTFTVGGIDGVVIVSVDGATLTLSAVLDAGAP